MSKKLSNKYYRHSVITNFYASKLVGKLVKLAPACPVLTELRLAPNSIVAVLATNRQSVKVLAITTDGEAIVAVISYEYLRLPGAVVPSKKLVQAGQSRSGITLTFRDAFTLI